MARRRSSTVLCGNCGRLVHVSEKRCPYCGAPRPALGAWLRRGPGGEPLDVVRAIGAACVALYVVSLALDPRALLEWRGLFSIAAPSSRALSLLGMTGGLATACGFGWTVLSAGFLHGSLLHLAFNLMWIRALGGEAVRWYGNARFFVIYTVSSAVAFTLSDALGAPPTIGASAAIFGIGGALMGLGLRTRGRLTALLDQQSIFWGGLVLALGFLGGMGVNNVAHFGGLAAGFALSWAVPARERAVGGRAWAAAALALAAATAGAIAFSAFKMWPFFQFGVLPCAVHGG